MNETSQPHSQQSTIMEINKTINYLSNSRNIL